jgi:hypothetical protein
VDTVQGEGAEGDDDAHVREDRQLALQVRETVVALVWGGLVVRWGAANDSGDIGAGQPQAIIALLTRGLVREAGFVQGAVEPVT